MLAEECAALLEGFFCSSARFGLARPRDVSSSAVACPSGLRSTPRKRVTGNPRPRVQIPPPPPSSASLSSQVAHGIPVHTTRSGANWYASTIKSVLESQDAIAQSVEA